jgi:SP family myo-inositol transporter-like MFS transporter 13
MEAIGVVEEGPLLGDSTWMLIYLTVLASIGGLLFGYDTGIISGALVELGTDFNLRDVDEELVVSLTVAGALCSALSSGYAGDKLGRKPVVLISSVLFTIGAIAMGLARNISDLLIGRFVVGLGVGSASMIVPVYLAECAPAAHRGAIVTCMNVALTFGQLLACLIAGIFSTTPEGWRYMLGIAAVPAIIQLIGVAFFVPESPRYLVSTGLVDKARDALVALRGTGTGIEHELRDICEALDNERAAILREVGSSDGSGGGNGIENNDDYSLSTHQLLSPLSSSSSSSSPSPPPPPSPSPEAGAGAGALSSPNDKNRETREAVALSVNPWSLLRITSNSRALFLGCMVQFGQQFGGINTVMYYGASIFTLAGASRVTAIWLSLGLASFNFTGTCIGFYLSDRLGRRPLAIGSMFLVSASLASIGLAFLFTQSTRDRLAQEADDVSSSSEIVPALWIIFAATCTYLVVFAAGMGCMPWTICAEIFPLSIRSVATSITTTANWTANLAMSMTFLSLTTALTTQGAFGVYTLVSFAFACFYYRYLPETRGVALEDTPLLFSDAMWGKQAGWGLVPAAAGPADKRDR